MEEIGKDFYFYIVKPALMLAMTILAIVITNRFVGDDIRESVTLFIKEVRAVLNRDRNMKSLNALVVVMTTFALLLLALALGPQPEDVMFVFGKGLMYSILIVVASLFCVHLVRSDRDQ